MSEKLEPNQPIKKVQFRVDGIEYSVTCKFTAGDFMRIAEAIENGRTNYKELFARSIQMKVHADTDAPSPSIEQIMALPEEFFEEYIAGILDRNCEYRAYYDRYDCVRDPCERFSHAVEECMKENLSAALKTIVDNPAVKILAEQTHQLKEFTEKIVAPALQSLAEYTKKLAEISIGPISAAIEKLGKLAAEIRTPSITESEKEELIASYEKWGYYGWTMAPEMLFGFFDEPPVDRKTANKEALKFCTSEDVAKLFTQLRETEGVKLPDLEEAIFDFEHRKYKSCILVVYSLIDAKLIRLQKKENRRGRKNSRGEGMRPSGATAGENVINRIRSLPQEQQSLMLTLICTNVLACIKELFKMGDDFIEQPAEANRQFISHGMITRSVKRMDCIKAFLLYYNLLQLINWKL